MGKGTLDVTTDVLAAIPYVLPAGTHVMGSEAMMGAVRLVLQGPGIEDGRRYQLVVVAEQASRTYRLAEADPQPEPEVEHQKGTSLPKLTKPQNKQGPGKSAVNADGITPSPPAPDAPVAKPKRKRKAKADG